VLAWGHSCTVCVRVLRHQEENRYKNVGDYAVKIDWKLIVAIVALIASIFAGTFWRTPDIVFDKRAAEIPLSDPLRKTIEDALASAHSDSVSVLKNGKERHSSPHLPSTKLPDKLLYVDVRNVGHVPSARIKVRIVVPGEIADKDVADAGSAFGSISQLMESNSTGELSFECQNLANHPQARIKIALWYQQTKPGSPSVEIQDTLTGPAREVGSVEDARFYWLEWLEEYVAPVAALLGFVASFFLIGVLNHNLKKRSLSKFTAVYDPSNCAWAEGSREGKPVMQVFATASLASKGEKSIEIVQAYLKGTKPVSNLLPFLVAPAGTAVTETFHFFVEPVVVKVGESYRGRIILVDKHDLKYESDEVSLPYRGAASTPSHPTVL